MSDRIDELVRRIRLASTTAEYAADHEAALTELATIAREALAPLVKEVCQTCHGKGGGGGFDRDGSHNADEYREYPCQTCGKEATDD